MSFVATSFDQMFANDSAALNPFGKAKVVTKFIPEKYKYWDDKYLMMQRVATTLPFLFDNRYDTVIPIRHFRSLD